jgi:hypothetical protein
MRPTSPTLPALGNELQKILAEPHAHTLGAASAVIERLLAELQIMQLCMPSQACVGPMPDASLDALFDAELARDPLSDDDVGALAGQLLAD